MHSSLLDFLRPSFAAVIAFGVMVGVMNLAFDRPTAESDFLNSDQLTGGDSDSLDLSSVVTPNPRLTPAEVVKLQLAGLSDRQADGVGILQCYCFASPGNRAVTGPLERFGHMVRQGSYQAMAEPRALLIGKPAYQDRLARLLVTVIDAQSHVRAFTFFLSRQAEPPFADCWMTEAVLPALPLPAEPAAPPPAA